jgi:nucleoside-diphosphate-sugar epimerase
MAGKTVCVTGAGGFVASWIVKTLLDHGYTVRGTVRNLEKSKHLLEFPGATDRLNLFVANLMEPGSFDNVVEGCDGVFHTATPILFNGITDPQVFFFFFFFTLQIFTLLFMLQLVAKSNVFGRLYFALIQNKR